VDCARASRHAQIEDSARKLILHCFNLCAIIFFNRHVFIPFKFFFKKRYKTMENDKKKSIKKAAKY